MGDWLSDWVRELCMSDFVSDLVSDLVGEICMSDWVSQITMGGLVARFV